MTGEKDLKASAHAAGQEEVHPEKHQSCLGRRAQQTPGTNKFTKI